MESCNESVVSMTIWSLAKEFEGYLTAIMLIDKVSNQIEIHQEQTITQTVQYTSLYDI